MALAALLASGPAAGQPAGAGRAGPASRRRSRHDRERGRRRTGRRARGSSPVAGNARTARRAQRPATASTRCAICRRVLHHLGDAEPAMRRRPTDGPRRLPDAGCRHRRAAGRRVSISRSCPAATSPAASWTRTARRSRAPVVEALRHAIRERDATRWSPSRTSETDDRGEFRLYGLRSRPVLRQRRRSGVSQRRARPKGVLRYSPTYLPGRAVRRSGQAGRGAGAGEAPRGRVQAEIVPPARVSGQLRLRRCARVDQRRDHHDARSKAKGSRWCRRRIRRSCRTAGSASATSCPGTTRSARAARPIRRARRCFAVFSLEVLGSDVGGIRMTLRPGAVIEGTLAVESRARHETAAASRAARARAVHRRQQLRRRADGHGPAGRRVRAARGHEGLAPDRASTGCTPPWVVKRCSTAAATSPIAAVDVEREGTAARRADHDQRRGRARSPGVVQNARQPAGAERRRAGLFARAALLDADEPPHARRLHRSRRDGLPSPGFPPASTLRSRRWTVDESDLGRRDRLQRAAGRSPLRLQPRQRRRSRDGDHSTLIVQP